MANRYIKMEKRIHLGQICRIHPSMGFAGIEYGHIKVVDFITCSELPKYIDVKCWVDDEPDLENEYWVKYVYTDKKHSEYGTDCYLPSSYFMLHTTIYQEEKE